MQPKKLHTLLIKSFFPPFIITLFVSVFLFFLVEIVITYLDDLIGKGLTVWTLGKLFFYAWIAIIPRCIPLAVLLSSIMTFGSLAENYELAAMKSSGLSLFRIIKPVFYCVVLLASLTFIFNNFVLPRVMLLSQSLLWDIRQAKPAMNIKEGIFYNKIDDYSMRVGRKGKDGHTIGDVIIYDHTARRGNNVQLYADSGHIEQTPDTNYLVIQLANGNRYEEMVPDDGDKTTRPLSQLNFRELEVNIPLTDFKLKRTDQNLFKEHHEMMNIWQIGHGIDTIQKKINNKYDGLVSQSKQYFFNRTINLIKKPMRTPINVRKFYSELPVTDFNRCVENAMNLARNSSAYVESTSEGAQSETLRKIEYQVGWHEKINVCFACIILFFVGAPLGAIIRKGGLGMPVIVAVVFFLAYFIFNEAFKSLTLEGVLSPWIGMWMPLYIFLPLGFFLTYKAATDSAIFDVNVYFDPIKRLFRRNKN